MGSEAMPERPSFAAVAERRFRLAGKSIIEKGHPYFVPVDRLEAMYASKPDGYVSLAHYDYLGLGRHPEVIEAAADQPRGAGAGAERRAAAAPRGWSAANASRTARWNATWRNSWASATC